MYSHLSEEERQVIQIEMGNGASVRRMAMMPGRHASTVSRENRNGMIRRYPPKRTPIAPSMARELQETVDKPTTGPCECSASAPPPRHSPTNC